MKRTILICFLLMGCVGSEEKPAQPAPKPATENAVTYRTTSDTGCYRQADGTVAHDLSVNQLESKCPCGMENEWPEAYKGKFGGTLGTREER